MQSKWPPNVPKNSMPRRDWPVAKFAQIPFLLHTHTLISVSNARNGFSALHAFFDELKKSINLKKKKKREKTNYYLHKF